jgi:hypothetical protein
VIRALLRSKHFVVVVDDATRLLRRTRTVARFESHEELEAAYFELLHAMSTIDRTKYAQLIDARQAPPRNDPAFEELVARHHDELYRGFRASAVLVQSAAGKLQVRRMLGASGVGAPVFTEEEAALAYLRSPPKPED